MTIVRRVFDGSPASVNLVIPSSEFANRSGAMALL